MTCCPPFRQPCTLGPMTDALRQTAGDIAVMPLSPLAGALRPLIPEWAAVLPPSPEPLEDPGAARYRVYRALAELLVCLRVRLLVTEDVHWADEATLEFLLFLVARQPNGPKRHSKSSVRNRGVARGWSRARRRRASGLVIGCGSRNGSA